ncbi:MAG: hypothetical protein PHT89_02335 [Lachnospiraceae bacterium]|nr:hypothetical protein [Lachnospiraceae bacterium]MDD3659538.1 hypothetical protein [Lachnospiraceae bacterium]
MNRNDFKYVIQDLSKVYIGANYTYEELQNEDDMPVKFKEAAFRVFSMETSLATTIAAHLLSIKKEDRSYFVYKQMRVKIKVTSLVRGSNAFSTGSYKLDEFMDEFQNKAVQGEYFIEELEIKKLHLAGLSV